MDVLLSLVAGLIFRVFLGSLDDDLGRLGPALLGLWEGAAVYHLSHAHSPDHYLAYALRVAVDLYVRGNFQRTLLVIIWTILGIVASEAVNPARPRRRRRSTHVRVYQAPSIDIAVPAPRLSTPPLRPSRPPSPPSFFLQGESDANSNSPKYLPSALSAPASEESPLPLPIPLPTPPATLSRDAHDSDAASRRRLSTIAELSSGEEGSHVTYIGPRTATSAPPLPIPMRYLHPDEPSTSTPLPLPIPNPQSQRQRPMTPSEPDELQTPRATNTWEMTDHEHDELMTPPAPKELLSPLFSDFPDFGAKMDEPPPSVPVSALNPPTTTTPAVEYPPPTLSSSSSPPNASHHPEAPHSLHETETASTISMASDITTLASTHLYAKAEALRTEAREAEATRVRLVGEMARAVDEARVRDVLVLRDEMRTEEVRARKLHERAARRFYKARNAARKPHTVDVHGLRVAEAIQITERALLSALDRNHPFVRVIVGKGLHSRNGQAVLKGALIKTMQGLKIPCRVDPANAGVLIVSLAGF